MWLRLGRSQRKWWTAVRSQRMLKVLLFIPEQYTSLKTCYSLCLPHSPLLGKVKPPGHRSVSVCPCDLEPGTDPAQQGPCSPLRGRSCVHMLVCVCVCLTLPPSVPVLEPEHELFLVYGKGRPGIIRGMDMGAKVPDEHMIPIENLMNPRALDFHAETGFIYFADTTSYLIGRQKIDGTERETILKDGEATPLRRPPPRREVCG